MVQIWFGNTYLSFGQAESFHPVFGPILMTCFAALSNTLLLTSEQISVHVSTGSYVVTVLISILSNTFARIDAVSTSFSISSGSELKSYGIECQPGGTILSVKAQGQR